MVRLSPEKGLTNELIILYALEILGGAEKPVHMDDIAVSCYKLAPNRFAMKKYPEYPDMESVRKRLSDKTQGMMRRAQWVVGSMKNGWMLTPAGVNALRSNSSLLIDLKGGEPHPNEAQHERRHLYRKVQKVMSHVAYRKFMTEHEEPADFELLESVGCNLNTSSSVLATKLNALRMLSQEISESDIHDELTRYLNYCEERLLTTSGQKGAES